MVSFATTDRERHQNLLSHSPIATYFPANVTQLSNGLTLIHQFIPATPVVVVDIWVKAGALVEAEHQLGMAHFLEHMIFKGTDRLPPGCFDYEIESRGGMSNAATSYDYAHYFIVTADRHLKETFPLLVDLLLHPAIPESEFDREREVVLEELYQSQDDPDWLGFQALMEDVYRYHPYGRSILGTEERLKTYSAQQMRQFHQAHYQPENMTVVLVGNLEHQAALDLVSQHFQGFPLRQVGQTFEPQAEPPITTIRRQELHLPRLEQARLMMAWMGPGVDVAPHRLAEQFQAGYGLDLLSTLLTQGRSSRLVRELREERGLVQEIATSFSLQHDSSLFTLTAWLEPENLDRVEAIICDRLCQLQTTPITMAELQRCQRLLCNDYAFSTETPDQLAGLYGYYGTIAQAEQSVMYPSRVKALDPAYLKSLASQYLSPYHYAVTIVKPA